MFLIISYVAIFITLVYLIFHLFVEIGDFFLLIDEEFTDKINESKDIILKKFQNKNNSSEDKKLNSYLRLDFLITLSLGVLWFLIPGLLFLFKPEELKVLPREFKYLGQTFALLTLITTIIPVKTISKPTYEKKMVLGTKLFCAFIIAIMQAFYIYYFKRITIGNIISIILISFWSANSLRGLINHHNKTNKDFN